jgi:hypothetical protein
MAYSEALLRTEAAGREAGAMRESTLTEREVCQVLADHGCYLGDYLVDRELDALPAETDGESIADWLGY